jgi:hypothetical protein
MGSRLLDADALKPLWPSQPLAVAHQASFGTHVTGDPVSHSTVKYCGGVPTPNTP